MRDHSLLISHLINVESAILANQLWRMASMMRRLAFLCLKYLWWIFYTASVRNGRKMISLYALLDHKIYRIIILKYAEEKLYENDWEKLIIFTNDY